MKGEVRLQEVTLIAAAVKIALMYYLGYAVIILQNVF